MRITLCHLVFASILVYSAGCGGNSAVSGKVTFSDGTPLTVGKVVFETETFYAFGPIQSDGTYTMGSSKSGDGVPKGTYQVSIQDVVKPTIVQQGMRAPIITMPTSIPIDQKYFAGNTSGLACEVKGRMRYDITVEPPAGR